MKKIQCYIAIILFIFCFTACTQQQSLKTGSTPEEIAGTVINSQSEIPALSQLIYGNEEFDAYLSDYYLIDCGQVKGGVVCYAEGVEASEIAILVLENESDAKEIEESLLAYIENRAGVFEGYAPQQAALVKNGEVVVNGNYVALLICQDTSTAKKAFLSCFEDTDKDLSVEESISTYVTKTEEVTEPVVMESSQVSTTILNTENNSHMSQTKDTSSNTVDNINPEINGNKNYKNDEQENFVEKYVSTNERETEKITDSKSDENYYNSDAILEAWKTKDTSSLSKLNLSILNAAEDVIKKEIKADMSDYEKELAIHDWITGWSSFDYSVFGRSSSDGFKEGSDTPYGVLINREGMCHGYSSTFQLFMDMLDIECITVFGTPSSNGVEHSWNMVRLDGEWYCVDVAWDDPIGGMRNHDFFNVTSQYLRDSGIHKWDDSTVPEATATTYSFSN